MGAQPVRRKFASRRKSGSHPGEAGRGGQGDRREHRPPRPGKGRSKSGPSSLGRRDERGGWHVRRTESPSTIPFPWGHVLGRPRSKGERAGFDSSQRGKRQAGRTQDFRAPRAVICSPENSRDPPQSRAFVGPSPRAGGGSRRARRHREGGKGRRGQWPSISLRLGW